MAYESTALPLSYRGLVLQLHSGRVVFYTALIGLSTKQLHKNRFPSFLKRRYNGLVWLPDTPSKMIEGDDRMSEDLKIQDGQVVSMDYSLRVDGEVIDTSDGREPLEFIQGTGSIIPGLERELYGLLIGDSKKVTIAPLDAYGELDAEAYVEVPRVEFPNNIPLEKGIEIQVRDQNGQPMYARIDSFTDESIKLDFNHPLAGKTLNFDVTIVGLRDASAEELSHGHVHGQGHEH
jgi:FKBP-type peptidyl-prolyl cis-trans isomerase SlyD